ncbi:MAG: DNA polymerase III subunit gamma/tau, partial [bacterium]|nr:DNA polymerase III subunit gamma/tau [bacterium]
PQIFADVVNQKYIIQTLKNQVALGQISHAYLFTGSRGVGKTTVARIMAKAVNCLSKNGGEPCDVCEICKQVTAGNFLDLIEIDAASNTGVDNIRELIEHIKFSPSAGKYKVFIIDEVHMLSKGAFNALLKTLEEPPEHAIFILATTEAGKVPATIISRTQKFDFKALSEADIKIHLEKILEAEKIKLNPEIIELIALNAEGSVRDGLSLLDKILTLGEKVSLEESQRLLGITDLAICENLLSLIAEGKIFEIPEFFSWLLENGQDFSVLNRDFLEYLRKVLICKITEGQAERILTGEHKQKALDLSEKFSIADLIFTTRLYLRSFKELGSSPVAQ